MYGGYIMEKNKCDVGYIEKERVWKELKNILIVPDCSLCAKGSVASGIRKKKLAVIYFSLLTGIEEQRRKVIGFHLSVQLCLCIGWYGISMIVKCLWNFLFHTLQDIIKVYYLYEENFETDFFRN